MLILYKGPFCTEVVCIDENDLRRQFLEATLVQAGWESKRLFVDATYADIALLDISRVIVQFLYPLIITWSSKIYL